ncbi:hypothetical protein FisN_7Hu170 [Fistulifera solaris]|uniref:Uncharacterized protein n=1 Tax=Fistulifera solaris TaxID=1519565 RepID=A0A1Z5K3M9_FISSO|nr:hypothetical protein FisN_7Hu170 [Fistulifera solaris]|eukprot:GAX20854.1 hypothetical protein FisN_7Hu170 [Fistulifera solaris]
MVMVLAATLMETALAMAPMLMGLGMVLMEMALAMAPMVMALAMEPMVMALAMAKESLLDLKSPPREKESLRTILPHLVHPHRICLTYQALFRMALSRLARAPLMYQIHRLVCR